MSAHFDVVVEHGEVTTMDPGRSTFEGWVGVDGGRIAGLGAGTSDDIGAARRIDATGCLVRPGFVSAHHHSMDALARGSPERPMVFSDWLFGVYYATVLGLEPHDAARSATLVATDLLLSGVTTLVDCWGVGDVGTRRADECLAATLDVADHSGLRWVIAPMVADRIPAAWSEDIGRVASRDPRFRPAGMTSSTDAALEFVERTTAAARPLGLVDAWVAPELPEMASDELVAGLADLAQRTNGAMTTHLRASPDDPPDRSGRGAVERLAALGAVDPHLVAAHLTFASDGDLRLLGAAGAGAAHCPTASMMLGGSRSVAGRVVGAGVPVGLGLDNQSLNAVADMGAEMRQAIMFDRTCSPIPPSLTADMVVAMATCDGARAIGFDHIGSIEVGKSADLVVVDRSGVHWEPRRRPEVAVCFQERVGDVRHVLINGRHVVADGTVTSLG